MSDLLKNKISNYEIQPPADVWKNIASELNESKAFQPLSEKLYHYEVLPPTDSWSNISSLLATEVKTPVRRMGQLFIKLAAAAVLIGLILVSSLYVMHQEKAGQKTNLANVPSKARKQNTQPPAAQDQVASKPQVTTSLPTITFTNTSRERTVSKNRYPLRRRVLAAAAITNDDIARKENMNNIVIHGNLIRNERGDVIQDPYMLTGGDEYISVTGPNGQQTRISSKFANVMLYLNGNEQMQDAEWQRKFQDWRNKIMQTSFIPSSNNFLDILELKDFILKDNQQ